MPIKNDADHRDILRVRPATIQDSADILRWRNDAHTRAMSIEQTLIDPVRHAAWYQAALTSAAKILLIGEVIGGSGEGGSGGSDLGKSGVVRFDRRNRRQWEVSITIAPEVRGGGYGKLLLAAALSYFHDRCPECTLLARIKSCNEASLRLFGALGFATEQDSAPRGSDIDIGVAPGMVVYSKTFV